MHRLFTPVLLCAALAAQETSARPAVAANRFVPADSFVVARIAGPARWQKKFAKTQVMKLLHGQVLAPLLAQATEGYEAAIAELRTSGKFDADLVERLLTDYTGDLVLSMQIDWADLAAAMQDDRPPAFSMVIALAPDGSYDLAALEDAIGKAIETSGEHRRPLRDLTVGDRRLRITSDDDSVEACVPTMIDGHLVMLVGADLEKSAERLLGTEARYEGTLGNQPFFAHAKLDRAMSAVMAAATEQMDASGAPFDVAAMIEMLGLASLDSLTLSLDADDQSTLAEMNLAMGDGETGLFGMAMFPQTSKLIRLVPPAAEWFSVSPFDLNALYRTIAKVWEEVGDQVPMSLDDAKAAFAEATKVRLEEDLLAHVGTEIMMVEDPEIFAELEESSAPSMIDGSCIVVSLRDGKAFGTAVETALRARGLHASRKSEDYGDHKVYRMKLAGLIDIEYAITEDMVLLAVGDHEGARRNLRAVLDTGKAAPTGGELPAAAQKRIQAVQAGWSGLSVTPIGQVLQGIGSSLEGLAALGEMPEGMSQLIEVMQGLGGEVQRLGIDHLISTTYTTARSMHVHTRW